MHHTHTNLYTVKVPAPFPCGPSRACLTGTVCQDYPVQRPLARLRVMLSRRVIAYYGLIRDSRPSRRLIFFVQRVFALRPRMGWYRELPQFNPHICSTVPSAVPRRFERLHATVPSPLALAFASSAQARLKHTTHSGSHVGRVTRLYHDSSLSLRPGGLLALHRKGRLLSSFHLMSHPKKGVEYDYTGKQSIPVAGLSPARYAALWAANGFTLIGTD